MHTCNDDVWCLMGINTEGYIYQRVKFKFILKINLHYIIVDRML